MPTKERRFTPGQDHKKLYGLIECMCGGWHPIEEINIGSDRHGWEKHTKPIKCDNCKRTLMCHECGPNTPDYCTVLGEAEWSNPAETEVREV